MRWLLTSWGSRGDLHPFLAMGQGLIARGHEVTLVGHPDWESETITAGLRFVSTGEPPRDDLLRRHPEIMSMKWGGISALHALVHHGIAPGLSQMLDALFKEAPDHDAIIAHHFVFPAPMAADLAGKPWATVSLAPGVIPSAYSRPGASFLRPGRGIIDRTLNRFLWAGGNISTRMVVDPLVNQLRAQHKLAPVRHAVFKAHSPLLNLQLYSPQFAPPPTDWSAEKRQTGFCYYTPLDLKGLPEEVETFLARGEPPVLVTLGSAAVQTPGAFYEEAAKALEALRLRGILLTGSEENRPAHLPRDVMAISYAPYGLIMPRVRAVVHQCGIGTLSHTLLAGVPSVACPFAFDQPNNARRLEALGVAEMVMPGRRTAPHLAEALRNLFFGEAPARAKRLGELLRVEDGVGRTCDVLEEIFANRAAAH